MYPGVKLNCCRREEGPWALWHRAHPRSLVALRDLGIEGAEFSLWHRPHALRFTADEEMARVWEEVRRCIDAGLRVHLHPYVHIDQRGPAHMTAATRGPVVEHIDRIVTLAARILERQRAPVTLVYHPAEAALPEPSGSEPPRASAWRRELRRRSIAFFAHVRECVRPYAEGIVVACETQLPGNERMIRIGDRPDELAALAGESGCRICWDTGHFLKSAEALAFDPLPPDAFLDRLGHVHLHAVVNGKDHRPATPDHAYLRQCLRRMHTSGFAGCVTLEYNFTRVPDITPDRMHRILADGVSMIRTAAGA